MGYEVDFLAVGDGERGGDAIAARFGNLHGSHDNQIVVVIDGGPSGYGKRLADHIRRYYKTERVDLVISTHPDADHSNGLITLLDEISVGCLAMHLPWNHTDDIARLFKDGRVTDKSVRVQLRRSLNSASELHTKAVRKGIKVVEPFQGTGGFDRQVQILGPTTEYYESLLPHFRDTPTPRMEDLLPELLQSGVATVARKAESLDIETLTDSGPGTSAENNSSAITLMNVDGTPLLFTADAGAPALDFAANQLASLGITPGSLNFVQVPHHGSRRNVGPSILNRLLGPRLTQEVKTTTAFCSCPQQSEKHPAKKVCNAFRRRGAPVYSTQDGKSLCHSFDAPDRGWETAKPHPLYSEVEED